jgi:hypothetical protein
MNRQLSSNGMVLYTDERLRALIVRLKFVLKFDSFF